MLFFKKSETFSEYETLIYVMISKKYREEVKILRNLAEITKDVLKRATELELKKYAGRIICIGTGGVLLCALIVFALSKTAGNGVVYLSDKPEYGAALYGTSAMGGYVFVGIAAFVIGVVSACMYLKKKETMEKKYL